MDFIEFKLQNIQHEINDINKFLLVKKQDLNFDLYNDIKLVEQQQQQLQPQQTQYQKQLQQQQSQYQQFLLNQNTNIIDDKCINNKQINEKQFDKKWSNIVDDKDLNDFINKITDVDQQIQKLKSYLNINKKSKFIKFEFANSIITWELQEKHNQNGITKITINPVYNNFEIFQNFYYNINNNKIGIKIKDIEYIWYQIDFKQRLLKYFDYNDQSRFVY